MKEYIDVGKIDIDMYKNLSDKNIITDQVIITNKQIEHINQERLGTYEKYRTKLVEILQKPDYIIKDKKHEETGLVIKKYDKNVILVIKLNTSVKEKKNSIITIWEIKEKRLERYLLTYRTIYKKE